MPLGRIKALARGGTSQKFASGADYFDALAGYENILVHSGPAPSGQAIDNAWRGASTGTPAGRR
jgi:alkyl hydroperoxide reductase subunit AhpF